jgi:hypothetical protein
LKAPGYAGGLFAYEVLEADVQGEIEIENSE